MEIKTARDYPQLSDWLDRHNGRRLWVAMNEHGNRIEAWQLTGGRGVLVEVHPGGHGWDLWTNLDNLGVAEVAYAKPPRYRVQVCTPRDAHARLPHNAQWRTVATYTTPRGLARAAARLREIADYARTHGNAAASGSRVVSPDGTITPADTACLWTWPGWSDGVTVIGDDARKNRARDTDAKRRQCKRCGAWYFAPLYTLDPGLCPEHRGTGA